MTIRTRLTLLFVLLVASILLLFSVSIYYSFDKFRETEFYGRLEDKAAESLLNQSGQNPKVKLPQLFHQSLLIYDSNGRLIHKSGFSGPSISAEAIQQVQNGKTLRFKEEQKEGLGFKYKDKQGNTLLLFISGFDRYGFSKLDRLRQILFMGWLLGLIVVGIAGWFFATDTIRPVSIIIDQVNAISATSIHKRLEIGPQSDELSKLAYTFNNMLSRLEEAFISQKSFVSHASHELRTPLTVMMGQIEVTLMQTRTKSEYEATLLAVLDEVKRMNTLVSGLLELARANADASTLSFKYVRIDELLWLARANLLHKNPDYRIQIDFKNLPDHEEDLTIWAEEPLLLTAFQNLMENGCKYSPDEHINVQISFLPGQIQLLFVDHGYGISETDLPHIFDPFYRSPDMIGLKGHGIGLALTHRIITIHQGQIRIDSEKGKGTHISVNFPLGSTNGLENPRTQVSTGNTL